MQNLGSLAAFVLLVILAAGTGAHFMPGEWYAALNKPSWTPPNWLFPIAWTIFYTMIAIAGWLTWKAAGWTPALTVWGVGLVLNALWSYVMFGRHDIGLALADIAALWLATAAFAIMARPIDSRAALLFAPYLLWVTFAGALNFAVWRMN